MHIAHDRERIGRYEVVGRLARGGMAEILLGRLTGPSGFERSVVIKRILPAYAEERQFVEMFLDEARIAARIHHPNVVQHQELGREGEQLYLVLEYLDGESLASVQRRARSRADALAYVEAGYIIASAAAGLHAAHEMTDHHGKALGIVHRDVSPQNLFVTYRGGVKVMDFGIAKASDRITRTEAGSLKGKIRYMSPEQARGEQLDRRSDLFSLGVVLYELTTGRALFRRGTPLASLRAVQDEPIPPPSQVAADYPAVLERVCLRALARKRDDRYPDVLEFRAALLEAMAEIGAPARPEEQLSAHMERLFGDRIAEKKEMLRRVSHGAEGLTPPEAEVDTDVELPSVVEPYDEDLGVTVAVPRTAPRPGRKRGLAAALGLVVLGGAGALVAGGDPRIIPTSAPARSKAERPHEGPGAADAGLAGLVAVTPARVRVSVESEPSGATVSVAGEDAGRTPAALSLDRGDTALPVRLSLDGYRTLDLDIVPDVDQRLRLSLRPEPRPRRRTTPEPATPPGAMAAEPSAFPRFN